MTTQPDALSRQGGTERSVRADGPLPLLRAHLSITTVDDLDQAVALAEAWEELAAAAGASPFVQPAYALTWWRHRGRGRLRLVTVRAGDQLVVLVPLHVRQLAALPVTRWLGHGLGTVAEVLVRPGWRAAAADMWSALAEDSRLLLDLVEYRDDGGGLAELRRCSELQSDLRLHDVCPVIELEQLPSAEAVIDRLHRRHAVRRSVARARRRLVDHDASVRVDVCRDWDSVAAVLPEIERIYDVAEADRPRLHLLREPWRSFLLELLDKWAALDQLAVHVLRVDGRAAAFEITVDYQTTRSHWVTRFDPAAAEYSPGHLLTLSVLDDALARGLRRCDLLLGDGAHKLPYATASYDTLSVRAAPSSLAVRQGVVDATTRARSAAGRVVGALRRSR